MTPKPEYFDRIKLKASQRWDQLEQDPDLAGPWHQLFKQVQSPRHVLSELLQNADDAGATEASVRIERQVFIFEHNGEDFKEEHFASLCRFGYSNKRALHTIGFRGIGFKSIFSLGDVIELRTPSLSVSFKRHRFTEPLLLPKQDKVPNTQIRVVIADDLRLKEISKNLVEWLHSPISLLFFRNIRALTINGKILRWTSTKPGPIADSEWMALNGNPGETFLVARSIPESFPQDALQEIRNERLVDDDQLKDFPPSKVELVLGAKGKLYVVLPTGVTTNLPFASNAPFIQDPARLKIKDPELSPTNRWLLQRIGRLAMSTLLAWLQEKKATDQEKAKAYALLPEYESDDGSLEGLCSSTIKEPMQSLLSASAVVLTESGKLAKPGVATVIPSELFEIWQADDLCKNLDEEHQTLANRNISSADQNKLIHWELVLDITRDHVLLMLRQRSFPKPRQWRQLLQLWSYVGESAKSSWIDLKTLHIVPVNGNDSLHPAERIVRLGEKRLLQSDSDWQFLANHLQVLNPNWPNYLAEQQRDSIGAAEWTKIQVRAALSILKQIGLNEASDASKVIEQVASSFFDAEKVPITDCVTFAQLSCKLGATVSDSFNFVTRDNVRRKPAYGLLNDPNKALEELLPAKWYSTHSLHEAYQHRFQACTQEEWAEWVKSDKSGLLAFPAIKQTVIDIWGKKNLAAQLTARNCDGQFSTPYVTSNFQLLDHDFDENLWAHWRSLAASTPETWSCILSHIISHPRNWEDALEAEAVQVSTNKSRRTVYFGDVPSSWIVKFRTLPCLKDTKGFPRQPVELMRRTPETEPHMDLELFLDARLDTEANRPLFDLLGVRNTPTGPGKLLVILRGLSHETNPDAYRIEKWYHRLDHLVNYCSTADFQEIRQALLAEPLILTEQNTWSAGNSIFLAANEDDVPDAAVIRRSVANLALWRKIGIADHPTAELALAWLETLPREAALDPDQLRRCRAFLARHPARAWYETGSWLNLSNQWVANETLLYALTMRSLTPWTHLHESIKGQTADFQKLPGDIVDSEPFVRLPTLASIVDERVSADTYEFVTETPIPWLNLAGKYLSRVRQSDEQEQTRIRELGRALATTVLCKVPRLETVPYVGGTPAGTARETDLVWDKKVLFIKAVNRARQASTIPDRVGKHFARSDIIAALSYCYERQDEQIAEYMEENFQLVAESDLPREVPAKREMASPRYSRHLIALH